MEKEFRLIIKVSSGLTPEEYLRAQFIKSLIEKGKIGKGDLAAEKREVFSVVRGWYERVNLTKLWSSAGTIGTVTTLVAASVVTGDIVFAVAGTGIGLLSLCEDQS